MTKFDCLLDDPHAPDWGPTPLYPGMLYTMDDQCRFDFGAGYKQCTAFRNLDVCRILWCSHDENPMFCKTKNGPPVDGTECGENMWCFKSHCVWRNHQTVEVDGNWGLWSSYGACSRSCGTGVMSRTRDCDNPAPSSGGQACPGKDREYSLCNKRPCPGSRDFRAEQCRYHRKKTYANRRHTWLPYESEHEDLKCELFCVSKETNDLVSMGTSVANGTPCSYEDPHSICIDATCTKIGCDKVIGSTRREDECGVCGGNGNQCRRMNGTYRKPVRRPNNSYMKMFSIPVNARKIRIQEAAGPNPVHIIAMKNRRTSRYVLNQRNKLVESDVRMNFIDAGTRWTYIREGGRETISAAGPLSAEILFLLVTQSRAVRPNIQYSYVMHSRNVKNVYHYVLKKWYPCSVTCGTGTRQARFVCRHKLTGRSTRKSNCAGISQPRVRKPCTVTCKLPPSWYIGEWGTCSKTCGSGGVQVRKVQCHQQTSKGPEKKIVEDRFCESTERKPAETVPCEKRSCPSKWRTGSWSSCSVSCGSGGIRRRQVTCGSPRSSSRAVCESPKPPSEEKCLVPSCSDDVCERDQSLLCKLDTMTKYCSVAGFRQMCCITCRSHGSGASAPSDDVQAAHRANLTLIVNGTNFTNHESSILSVDFFTDSTVETPLIRKPLVREDETDDNNARRQDPSTSQTRKTRHRRSVVESDIGENMNLLNGKKPNIQSRWRTKRMD